MNPAEMTGLELMQAMVEGKLPVAPMSETIPMKGTLAEKGKVVFETMADDRHLNVFGGVHGGFAATILDSLTGCVVHTMLEPGVGYATIDLNVKMVRPVPKDTVLIAEGNIINMSKSLGVSDGTLKCKEGKLYAHATATCMILGRN